MMRNATHMEFVTALTGSTTIARAADIDAETAAMADRMVDGGDEVDDLAITLYGRYEHRECFEVLYQGGIVAVCILCLSQDGYEAAWSLTEASAPPVTVLHRPRAAPWLSAVLTPGYGALPRDLQLGVPWLEMAVAWRLLRDYEAGELRGLRRPPPAR